MRAIASVALCLFSGCCIGDCCDKPIPQPRVCAAPTGEVSNTGDPFEPNDTMPMAAAPAFHTVDCAMTSRTATISSAADTDVFRTGACQVTEHDAPYAEMLTDEPSLRTCLFLACDTGTTNVFKCYETAENDSEDVATARVLPSRSDGGFRGCCRTGKGRVTAKVQCSGFPLRNHGVEGYIWIDSNDENNNTSRDYSVVYLL